MAVTLVFSPRSLATTFVPDATPVFASHRPTKQELEDVLHHAQLRAHTRRLRQTLEECLDHLDLDVPDGLAEQVQPVEVRAAGNEAPQVVAVDEAFERIVEVLNTR